ncbi:MAG: alpha-D-ribose 1-methylphosphonate 5-triphosphate diphosphatase [Actinomycetota bacterium]
MRSSGSTAITDVRLVTADAVTEPTTVVVDGDVIVDITSGTPPDGAVDGRGALLVPGLVDSHCDGLEKEISPRRTVQFPLDYGLRSFEGRVRAAGVTTVCHGIGFQEKPNSGRSVEHAREMCAAIDRRRGDDSVGVDHRILYRIEARDAGAVGPLLDDLGRRDPDLGVPLVSFEDHTPGQGQYRDVSQFEAAVDPTLLPEGVTVKEHVARLIADAEAVRHVRDANRTRIAPLAREGAIRLLAHDLETLDDVADALDAGAAIAEFPLTSEVAKQAKAEGMTTVMGAPNALRGHSHSGNTSARELVAAGLCDVLASDYMPTAMLAAAFAMAADRICSLPEAIALVTSGPAEMIGARDRGRLEVGAVADLVLVDDRGQWPVVLGVHRAGDDMARAVFSS